MKTALPVKIVPHDFVARDLVGGDAALDFVNTVTGRDESPHDWLESYARLLEWTALVQLLPDSSVRALAKRARREPAAAAAALTRAKTLREAMFAVVTRTIAGNAPPKDALVLLRKQWIAGLAAHELRFAAGRVTAALRPDAADFDLIARLVARRLVEEVLQAPAGRLRLCQGPNCSWLFLDRSKAGRRRWCDMAVCGNAAKSRRFLARSQRRRRAG